MHDELVYLRFHQQDTSTQKVQKEALHQALNMLNLNSEGINTKYWKKREKSYDLISRENNFKQSQIFSMRDERYAIFSYQWKTPWDRLTFYINDMNNPMLCDWLWVDIICLDQNNNKNKMRTIANSDFISKMPRNTTSWKCPLWRGAGLYMKFQVYRGPRWSIASVSAF